jgi:hypothetical protein
VNSSRIQLRRIPQSPILDESIAFGFADPPVVASRAKPDRREINPPATGFRALQANLIDQS